jgi:lipoprotein-anchoring transpeptidase ErfK/SrfK
VVRGVLTPYVPGQQATVRLYAGGRRIASRRLAVRPGRSGRGVFRVGMTVARASRVLVRASHQATPELGTAVAAPARLDVLPRRAGPGSSREGVALMQAHLRRLGYVTGRAGTFDGRTARAVLAFRKVTGMARTTRASKNVMRRIARGQGAFTIRRPTHGRHIEADLTRQVIALIEGGKVRRIYPISSGAPGTPTVVGSFRVYSKTPGTNAKGMVDSAYFIRGYATHGYPSVPIYPASHGCLRVPIPDARSLFNWIRIGTPVDVYHGPKPK